MFPEWKSKIQAGKNINESRGSAHDFALPTMLMLKTFGTLNATKQL
jgi:hypothetical protein